MATRPRGRRDVGIDPSTLHRKLSRFGGEVCRDGAAAPVAPHRASRHPRDPRHDRAMLAVASLLLFPEIAESRHAALSRSMLILADVMIFVAVRWVPGATARHSTIDEIVGAEAIAEGDLAPRPGMRADELARLAEPQPDDNPAARRADAARARGRPASAGSPPESRTRSATRSARSMATRTSCDAPGADGRDDGLNGIERETTRIDRIVRGLLDYARPRQHTNPDAIAIDESVERGATAARPRRATRSRCARDRRRRARAVRGSARAGAGPRQPPPQCDRRNAGNGTVTTAARADTMVARASATPPRTTIPRRPDDRERHPRAVHGRTASRSPPAVSRSPSPTRARRPSRGRGAHLRPVLHDQAAGEGDWTRPRDRRAYRRHLGGVVWVHRAREGGAAFVVDRRSHDVSSPVPSCVPRATGSGPGPRDEAPRRGRRARASPHDLPHPSR